MRSAPVSAAWRSPSSARCCTPRSSPTSGSAIAAAAGILLGIPLARVPLTAVPERTGLSQAFGGLAAALVGTAKYYLWLDEGELTSFRMAVIAGEVILGCLTCTGGLMAAGKLAEWITTRPVTYRGPEHRELHAPGVATGLGGWLVIDPSQSWAFPIVIALALVFGVLLILPIGGADMPTVISFLNSYAGLAAVAMGFVLENKLLIAAGALDGASGFVLSLIMCKAMNRSVSNVLFGAFGSVQTCAEVSRAAHRQECDAHGRGRTARQRRQRRHHSGLRNGRGAGAASRAGSLRSADQARRRREVRGAPGGRPDAGSHERAAGGSRHSLRPAHRDGRHQPGDAAGRAWRW